MEMNSRAPEDWAKLQVGFGMCDITPEESVPLAGAGNTSQRMSRGILNRLSLIFLAFTDEAGQTILLSSADLLVMPDQLAHEFRLAISETTNVPYDNIMLAATHSHNAPDQDNRAEPSIQRYIQKLRGWYVEAAQKAIADRRPARMLAGKTETDGLNFVRHYMTKAGIAKGDNFGDEVDSPYTGHTHEADRGMQLVRFARQAAKDILLVNWQVHPHRASSKFSGFHYMVASDMIGVLRETLAEETGMHVVYYTGAAGNLNPTSRIQEENVTADYLEQGKALAGYASKCLETLKPLREGPIHHITKRTAEKIDHHEDHKVGDAEIVLRDWIQRNDLIGAVRLANQYGINSPYHAAGILDKSRLPETDDLELHSFCIGELSVVTAPYEMFDSNGVYIKENSPFETTLIMTQTNQSRAYIPSEEGFRINSYEANAGRFEAGTGEKMAESFVQMLRQIYR